MQSFDEWETRLTPVLRGVLATLNQCERTYERQWAPALLSHADQLSATATMVREWNLAHPCPLPGLDRQLERLAVAYDYAGSSFESVAAGKSSVTWLVVAQELRRLRAVVTKLLTTLQRELEHLSQR